MMEDRGIPPLVALALSDDPSARGEACRAVANLTVNADMHQVLIKEGILGPLVSTT